MADSTYYKKGTVIQPQTTTEDGSVPSGGVAGYVLTKLSNRDFDYKWYPAPVPVVKQTTNVTNVYESASISGITEERAIAYSIALG